MKKVDFYHLTLQPLERVLPRICERVAGEGQRLLIVDADAERRARLDGLLWSYAPDSFLPHAQAGAADDTAQPVLLAEDVNPANRARWIALADGQWRDEALDFDRVFHFFDEETLRPARAAWKTLGTHEDVERRYWKHNEQGRWEQVA